MVDLQSERLSEVGLLSLAAATHSAVFAAPFALIGAGFGEWQRIGSWMYYVLVAIAIAAIGFLAQYWGEAQGAGEHRQQLRGDAPSCSPASSPGSSIGCLPGALRAGRDREPEIIPLPRRSLRRRPNGPSPAQAAT